MTKTFYTYLWLRENGTPYYVGKGHGKRAYRKGSPPLDRVLIQTFPNEIAAFSAEKFFISFYGRVDLGTGCLRNLTDGGEGGSGITYTPEMRRRISQRMRGNSNSAGCKLSLEACQKISRSLSGRKRTESHCRNISTGLRNSPNTRGPRPKRIAAVTSWWAKRTDDEVSNSALKGWETRRKKMAKQNG